MMNTKRLTLSSRDSKQVRLDTLPHIPSQNSVVNRTNRIFKHSEIPSIHSKQKPNKSSPNIIDQLFNNNNNNNDKSQQGRNNLETIEQFTSPTPKKSGFQEKISSTAFFSKKIQLRYDSLLNQSPELTTTLKTLPYKETNLYSIVSRISYIITELQQFKSEKALECQIQKQLDQHIRFQEIEWIFKTTKLKDWIQPEMLFRRIMVNFTVIQDNKLQIKKNKPEQLFLQILNDFSEKLDDLFRKLCEESYKGFSNSIRTERIKLQNKEIEVLHQFAKQSKKDSYVELQNILKGKFQMNLRAMESNIAHSLNIYEEKNGGFKFIGANHRYISSRIDDLLTEINN